MITANEANRLKRKSDIQKIEEFIIDAAEHGQNQIYVSGFLNPDDKQILEEHGYAVTEYNHAGMNEFVVRWG